MITAWLLRILPALVLALALTGGADRARAGAPACPSDCDANSVVSVGELVLAVGIAQETAELALCPAADLDGDAAVAIGELLVGVRSALEGCLASTADPGAGPWKPVPRAEVAARCGLDPDLLDAADMMIGRPYALVRYGQLCHEFYPTGPDQIEEVWSTTKTLGALVTGLVAYQTRDLPRTGRKTGPLSDTDRVDHWLDTFSFNRDARIAHVLAMVAHNPNLASGQRVFTYDALGSTQINRLSDVMRAAIAQDPQRLGGDLETFTQRFLFGPLGMHDSVWSNGAPDKVLGFTWYSTVRDMARVGLLLLHRGVWNGARLLDAEWVYKMTHPAFEDANTGYGYLTWMNSASNYTFGQTPGAPKRQTPVDPCAPVAVYQSYPHGLSESPNCNYEPPATCEQQIDAGMWFAAGLGGQYIVGHPGLDLVLVVKNFPSGPGGLWRAVRPALVARDPRFAGDEAGFCDAYARGEYAPDLR
ncbi:MAG: hypothetical protein AB7V27_07170 [Candidatus Binatia bacterium]